MSFGLKHQKSIETKNYRHGQVPTGAWIVVIFLIIALMSIFS